MIDIKYKVKEVKPNIFAVIIKDSYDRAMTFCRVQEYYESPNKKFRGKEFDIWEYMKWYSKAYGKGFSYAKDWSGFNLPYDVARKCLEEITSDSPYDDHMWYILNRVENLMTNLKAKAYIIGTGDDTGTTFDHELCHGFWYTNKTYKRNAEALVRALPKKHYDKIKKELLSMGYTDKVINDEVQAYMGTGLYTSFASPAIEKYRQPFIDNFNAFKNYGNNNK
jgi:hypothetical protein